MFWVGVILLPLPYPLISFFTFCSFLPEIVFQITRIIDHWLKKQSFSFIFSRGSVCVHSFTFQLFFTKVPRVKNSVLEFACCDAQRARAQ